jgi:hypothetical protein
MLVQKLRNCPEFIAGDTTRLRELLHLCIVDPAWRKEDETVYREST